MTDIIRLPKAKFIDRKEAIRSFFFKEMPASMEEQIIGGMKVFYPDVPSDPRLQDEQTIMIFPIFESSTLNDVWSAIRSAYNIVTEFDPVEVSQLDRWFHALTSERIQYHSEFLTLFGKHKIRGNTVTTLTNVAGIIVTFTPGILDEDGDEAFQNQPANYQIDALKELFTKHLKAGDVEITML